MTSQELFKKIGHDLSLENPDVTISQMFGMPALKVGKKVFAGYYDGAMTFKLTGAERDKALGVTGAKLFEPMPGHTMKEWVQIGEAAQNDWESLARQALAYVGDRQ
jgi:TfoX/Sxy family transcriptional regulator of competence genes